MRLGTLAPLYLQPEELKRRQARYERLAPPPLTPTMANLPADAGVPRTLEDEAACRASDAWVYREAMRTDPDEVDAILLDCVLDPALPALERDAPVPVFGILKLSASHLAGLGHRFAAVTRNRAIAEELERCIGRYGLQGAFLGTLVLDLGFDAIAEDATWNAALRRARGEAAARGASALINGCSAVDVDPIDNHDNVPVHIPAHVPDRVHGATTVVDPTALALRLLGLAVEQGLAAPRSRARVG